MYLDLSTSHHRFAAYDQSTDYIDWVANNENYNKLKASDYYQDTQRGLQEDTDYKHGLDAQNNAYRNAALSQQGSTARAGIAASRQNAQLAARTQLKSAKMQIDTSYRQFRERLNELDIPTLNLDIWYRQQTVALAKANLQLQARGPRNALQYSSAMGQLEGNGMVPASIAAIARNQSATAFSGQSGAPEPLTYENLAKQYGLDGGSGGGSSTDNGQMQTDQQRESSVLDAIKMVAARGPQGQTPGSFDSLTDYDREILSSGLEKLGYDAGDFFQRAQRAGIGQGSVRAA